jgi:MFS family permease
VLKALARILPVQLAIGLLMGLPVSHLPALQTASFGSGNSFFGVGALGGIKGVLSCVIAPSLGVLSDRVGRRLALTLALICAASPSFIGALSSTSYLGYGIVDAFFGYYAGAMTVCLAGVADATAKYDCDESQRAKALSIAMAALGAGFGGGTVAGSFVSTATAFLIGACCGIAAVAFVWTCWEDVAASAAPGARDGGMAPDAIQGDRQSQLQQQLVVSVPDASGEDGLNASRRVRFHLRDAKAEQNGSSGEDEQSPLTTNATLDKPRRVARAHQPHGPRRELYKQLRQEEEGGGAAASATDGGESADHDRLVHVGDDDGGATATAAATVPSAKKGTFSVAASSLARLRQVQAETRQLVGSAAGQAVALPGTAYRGASAAVRQSIDESLFTLRHYPALRRLAAIVFFDSLAETAMVQLLLLYLHGRLSFSQQQETGLVVTLGISSVIGLVYVIPALTARRGLRTLGTLRISLIANAVCVAFYSVVNNSTVALALPSMTILGIGAFPCAAALAATAVAETNEDGLAQGLLSGARMLAEGVAPLVLGAMLGALHDTSFPGAPFLVASVCVLFALWLTVGYRRIEACDLPKAWRIQRAAEAPSVLASAGHGHGGCTSSRNGGVRSAVPPPAGATTNVAAPTAVPPMPGPVVVVAPPQASAAVTTTESDAAASDFFNFVHQSTTTSRSAGGPAPVAVVPTTTASGAPAAAPIHVDEFDRLFQ